jgi:hypothetical protein
MPFLKTRLTLYSYIRNLGRENQLLLRLAWASLVPIDLFMSTQRIFGKSKRSLCHRLDNKRRLVSRRASPIELVKISDSPGLNKNQAMGKKPKKNWSKQYDIETKVVVVRKEEDIIRRVKLAIRHGTRVRAMGSLYNFVDIVQPMPSNRLTYPDVLLNMDSYNNVIEVDKKAMTVKVEAGAKLIDLGKQLEACNVLLANYGNVDGQSIGGLIATGTKKC